MPSLAIHRQRVQRDLVAAVSKQHRLRGEFDAKSEQKRQNCARIEELREQFAELRRKPNPSECDHHRIEDGVNERYWLYERNLVLDKSIQSVEIQLTQCHAHINELNHAMQPSTHVSDWWVVKLVLSFLTPEEQVHTCRKVSKAWRQFTDSFIRWVTLPWIGYVDESTDPADHSVTSRALAIWRKKWGKKKGPRGHKKQTLSIPMEDVLFLYSGPNSLLRVDGFPSDRMLFATGRFRPFHTQEFKTVRMRNKRELHMALRKAFLLKHFTVSELLGMAWDPFVWRVLKLAQDGSCQAIKNKWMYSVSTHTKTYDATAAPLMINKFMGPAMLQRARNAKRILRALPNATFKALRTKAHKRMRARHPLPMDVVFEHKEEMMLRSDPKMPRVGPVVDEDGDEAMGVIVV